MFRLTLIPFLLIFGALFFGIISFIIIRKLRQGIKLTVEKTQELAKKQQQKWAEKEQREKQPDILQKGFDQYNQLIKSHAKLPPEWKESLRPLLEDAKSILDEVADQKDITEIDTDKRINSIRSFFNHTLDALLQFSEKLNSSHNLMNTEQIEKARQTITVFKADLLQNKETLLKAKSMDFDVTMDVIKARLKK